MKRIGTILLAVLLMISAFCAFPMGALAADNIALKIEYTPTSLASAGNIDLKITAENKGDAVQNAVLTVDGKEVHTFGDLASGETKTWKDSSYKISDGKIGDDIKVELTYTNGEGAEKSVSKTFRVKQQAVNIKVVTKAKVDKTEVPYDTDVEFTFTVENQSDVTIENCVIKASNLNGGRGINSAFSLKPGKSKIVQYTGTIMKSIVVSPTLTYSVAGKKHTEDFDQLEILMAEAGLSVSAQIQNDVIEKGAEATFFIDIANTGNADLSNIKVFDSAGNRVATEGASLMAGRSMTVTYTAPYSESKEEVFRVEAEDSQGNAVEGISNAVNVMIGDEEEPAIDYASQLGLAVKVNTDQLKETGKIKLTFTVTNNSETTFTTLTIKEKSSQKELASFDELTPGSKEIEAEYPVEKSGELVFVLDALTETGAVVSVKSAPVDVQLNENQGGGVLGTLLIIVGIIILLIIGIGVTLLVLVKKDKLGKGKKEEKPVQAPRGQANAAAGPRVRRTAVNAGGLEEDAAIQRERARLREREALRNEHNEYQPEKNDSLFVDDIVEEAEKTVRKKEDDFAAKKPVQRRPIKKPTDDFDDRNLF